MKKTIAASAAAAVGLAMLAGCGGDDDGKVTLSYSVWSQDETMRQLIDAFEADHPDVEVELRVEPWTDYWTNLQVGASAGEAPDAFWMLGDHFQVYAANGQLLELDEAIAEADIDMSVYPEPLVDLFEYDGHQYGLPKDFDTVGLWYNEALFDAAGVAYPDETWTWEDVQAAAAELTDADAGVYGIAAPFNRQEGYYNTVAQAGGTIISDDGSTSGYGDPNTQEGIRYWADFIADGSSPTLEQMADTEAVAMFENGTVAMYYGGSFYASRFYENADLRAEADVTVLPAGERRATVINGIQNVGYAGTDHPEELAEFLMFLGGEEAALIQAESGEVIPAYEGTQQAWIDSMPEFDLQSFFDQVPDAVVYPVSANTSVWNELETELLTPVWNGEATVEEAGAELAARMDEALAEE